MKKIMISIILGSFLSLNCLANCDFIFKTIQKAEMPNTIYYGITEFTVGDISDIMFEPIIPLNEQTRNKLQEAVANGHSVCLHGTKFLGDTLKLFIYDIEFLSSAE